MTVHSNAVIVAFDGAPTGTPSTITLGLNQNTGDLYTYAAGVWHLIGSGGGGTPGGSNRQIQFNSAGSFGGATGLTFNSGTSTFEWLGGVTEIDDGNANIFIGTDFTPAGVFPPGTTTLNIGIGQNTLDSLNSAATPPNARENTAVGHFALNSCRNGHDNTAFGEETATSLLDETNVVAVGAFAFRNGRGDDNVAIGANTLNASTGVRNTAIGTTALGTNSTGTLNSALGWQADVSAGNLTNATAIGANAIVTASNSVQLGDANVTLVKTSASYAGAGLQLASRTVTGNDNATALDFLIRADATTGALTETLLASPPAGQIINVKKIDGTANNVTIAGNGHNIDGAATKVLTAQYQTAQLQYDATSTTWNVL